MHKNVLRGERERKDEEVSCRKKEAKNLILPCLLYISFSFYVIEMLLFHSALHSVRCSLSLSGNYTHS